MRSKLYALSFSILGGAALGLLAVSGGCSSSDSNAPPDDTGAGDDTGTGDTAPPPSDTRKDSHPADTSDAAYTCAAPLPTDFKCAAPTVTGVPSSSCTEDDLQSFVTTCIAANFGVGSGCGAWLAAHSACATCIQGFSFATSSGGAKVYPDRDQCFYHFFSDSCDTAWNCMFACDNAVCSSCDQTAGSGADGKTSEFQDCVKAERNHGGTLVPKGVCYDIATNQALNTCYPTLPSDSSYCVVSEEFTPTGSGGGPDLPTIRDEIVQYMRGACRDNGDWTHAADACSTPPCETGTETGVETGADADAGTDADETGDATTTETATDADDGSSDASDTADTAD